MTKKEPFRNKKASPAQNRPRQKDSPKPEDSLEETLFELIKKEHAHYQEILQITTEENVKLASSESIKEIPPLQKKKKRIMALIQELENAASPLKQCWLQKQDRSSETDRQIEAEMAAMNRVLAGILQMDLRNHKLMEMYLLIIKNKNQETGQAPEHIPGDT